MDTTTMESARGVSWGDYYVAPSAIRDSKTGEVVAYQMFIKHRSVGVLRPAFYAPHGNALPRFDSTADAWRAYLAAPPPLPEQEKRIDDGPQFAPASSLRSSEQREAVRALIKMYYPPPVVLPIGEEEEQGGTA